MHRAIAGDFANAELVAQIKINDGQTESNQCGGNGYGSSSQLYIGPDLGVIVVERTGDGLKLIVRAYDLSGKTLLSSNFSIALPTQWNGDCKLMLRGDNCFANGVITI